MKIILENIEFFAYHGYYDEEQKIGNKYTIDICIEANLQQAAKSDKLADTINYEKLYQIVAKEMATPARLLEHIAQKIIDTIFHNFAQVEAIEIAVGKHNPPIGGVCGKAKVILKQTRK
ncbi:MAG: dihydroneopterin aldolase [Raineya sp.]